MKPFRAPPDPIRLAPARRVGKPAESLGTCPACRTSLEVKPNLRTVERDGLTWHLHCYVAVEEPIAQRERAALDAARCTGLLTQWLALAQAYHARMAALRATLTAPSSPGMGKASRTVGGTSICSSPTAPGKRGTRTAPSR